MVDGHCAIFLEVVNYLVEVLGVVNTHRYTHLGGADHVDRRLVALEDLKYLTEETVGKKHSARFNLDGGDVLLCGYCLDGAGVSIVVDGGSGAASIIVW